MPYSIRRPHEAPLGVRPVEHKHRDEQLDALADHCIAARAIIAERRSPVMRRLIDLLLFEIGSELANRNQGKVGPTSQDS